MTPFDGTCNLFFWLTHVGVPSLILVPRTSSHQTAYADPQLGIPLCRYLRTHNLRSRRSPRLLRRVPDNADDEYPFHGRAIYRV